MAESAWQCPIQCVCTDPLTQLPLLHKLLVLLLHLLLQDGHLLLQVVQLITQETCLSRAPTRALWMEPLLDIDTQLGSCS